MEFKKRSACFIIMGAAVKPDGKPSGAMTRRVNAAVASSHNDFSNWFLVTGGFGKNLFSEAETMKRMLLAEGIREDQIIPERQATDTLSSVINCSMLIREYKPFDLIYVCSDRYHIPRCRWLFFLSGIRTLNVKVNSGMRANGRLKWFYFYFREVIALPFDTIVILIKKILR